MNIRIIVDCILIFCFSVYAFIPLQKKRIRAPWAKAVFVITAVFGIARTVFDLAWRMKWFVLGSDASYRFHVLSGEVLGMVLGLIFSLILSGQLLGAKRVDDIQQPEIKRNFA